VSLEFGGLLVVIELSELYGILLRPSASILKVVPWIWLEIHVIEPNLKVS
jgi:hypothetical protein